jgi:predicted chitinase
VEAVMALLPEAPSALRGMFAGQVAQESGGLSVLVENLNAEACSL